MRSTPFLIQATPGEDHVVHVRFEDGLAADVDLAYLLDYGGVFEPLREIDYFRACRPDAEAGTIVWPNEADPCARDPVRARVALRWDRGVATSTVRDRALSRSHGRRR